jgi:DNA primase
MKENLTFPQTIERLAQRAGIAIDPVRQRHTGNGPGNQLDAVKLGKINTWAMNCWVQNLWHPEIGAQARQYIQDRGLSEDMARSWQLGLAVNRWDDLTAKAVNKKEAVKSLVQAGLAVEKEQGGCYDKFRNRLMFPIMDVTGRVIGFGGRTLGDDPAKYMNSPATALFDKSNSLYGLYQAREAISNTGTAVVAEGYTDVMMAHQFGIENVVAALGTSLTDGHAKILRRYSKRIVLVFDSDVAGKAAANRALEICLGQKIDVRLAFVPEGKDPCEYLLEAGPDAFSAVIDGAQDVLEFKWNVLNEQLQASQNLSDRTEAIRQFLQTAAAAMESGQMDSIGRTVIVSRLSELLGVSSSRIEDEISAILKQKRRRERTDENESIEKPRGGVDLATKAQREILETLLLDEECFPRVQARVSVSDFGPDKQLRELAEAVFDVLESENDLKVSDVYARIESPQTAKLMTELQTAAQQKQDIYEQLEGALTELEKCRHRKQGSRREQMLTNDHELRDMLKQIAQKGPNLRSAGI